MIANAERGQCKVHSGLRLNTPGLLPPYKYNLWPPLQMELEGEGVGTPNNSSYSCKLFEPNKMLLSSEVSQAWLKSFRLYEQWSNAEE